MISRKLGQSVIDYIIKANLVQATCGEVLTWSANAEEQISKHLDDAIISQNILMELGLFPIEEEK